MLQSVIYRTVHLKDKHKTNSYKSIDPALSIARIVRQIYCCIRCTPLTFQESIFSREHHTPLLEDLYRFFIYFFFSFCIQLTVIVDHMHVQSCYILRFNSYRSKISFDYNIVQKSISFIFIREYALFSLYKNKYFLCNNLLFTKAGQCH